MTQEPGGGGIKLKCKVKEKSGVVMHESRTGWRSDFKVITQTERNKRGCNVLPKSPVEVRLN